ncbi:MAG: transporter [Pyrinomonadaceae bacterium]
MSATNSGITPDPGFLYSNNLLIYSRSTMRDGDGNIIARGSNSVLLDMNSLIWVSKKRILGGARFSMSATLPIARNSLNNDATGPISGGSGLGDQYYQPFILGWNKDRFAIRAIYGFLAPTGSYRAGANNNVGNGYWTHVVASGQTFYPAKNKRTNISVFEMYEWHLKQAGTNIDPGENIDLDYSVMHTLPLKGERSIQFGMIGYNQFQTTAKKGPTITPQQEHDRYKVYALGVGSHFIFPKQGLNFGFKYFKEFANRSTFQGYALQISGSYKF